MSDSFVLELPLEIDRQTQDVLDTRFNAARFLYNSILSECLKRLKLMQQSKEYMQARKLPKQTKERARLFNESRKKYKFEEYAIHKWLTGFNKSFPFKEHIDAILAQTLASRAFQAAKAFNLGMKKKPRFKGVRGMRSIEGKNNVTGIRFKNGEVVWGKLRLKPIYDNKDSHGVQAHALSCPVKYVRLVRKNIKGQHRYIAQLVLEGKPLCKYKTSQESVGIDLGPSTIAIVSHHHAELGLMTSTQEKISKHKQRQVSRSYAMHKRVTTRANRTYAELAEEKRVEAAKRKRELGKLANKILSLGTRIKLEKLSYKGWQKRFGKSVGKHAPAKLIEKLRYKAENAGGKLIEINTFKTKLSQTCHLCGRQEKKPLNQRQQACCCGIKMHRDVYSAFLALYTEEDCLDRCRAKKAWPCAQPLMEQAVSRCKEMTRNRKDLVRFGF